MFYTTDVDIDIDLEDLVASMSSRDKKELLEALDEDFSENEIKGITGVFDKKEFIELIVNKMWDVLGPKAFEYDQLIETIKNMKEGIKP